LFFYPGRLGQLGRRGRTFAGRLRGGELSVCGDNQDDAAIGRRHDIYCDTGMGTTDGINCFKERVTVIGVDGLPGAKEVSETN